MTVNLRAVRVVKILRRVSSALNEDISHGLPYGSSWPCLWLFGRWAGGRRPTAYGVLD
jgi:hypothetical protein